MSDIPEYNSGWNAWNLSIASWIASIAICFSYNQHYLDQHLDLKSSAQIETYWFTELDSVLLLKMRQSQNHLAIMMKR